MTDAEIERAASNEEPFEYVTYVGEREPVPPKASWWKIFRCDHDPINLRYYVYPDIREADCRKCGDTYSPNAAERFRSNLKEHIRKHGL